MTLTDAVVILNRLIEQCAIEQDFKTLEKLSFCKNEIIHHECKKRKQKY